MVENNEALERARQKAFEELKRVKNQRSPELGAAPAGDDDKMLQRINRKKAEESES